MTRPVALVVMGSAGHFHRMRPIVGSLARRGIPAVVMTHPMFADEVVRLGGRFVDLYAERSIDAADATSQPNPCRYVSFAGHYAQSVADELAPLSPALLIGDSFAVVGQVVAGMLDVPFVNVCSGHHVDSATFLDVLAHDPRVAVSEQCHWAVEQLRTRYGLADASPFSYVTTHSRWLNLYCEPPAFLPEPDRRPFEPIAFFGSLPSPEEMDELRRPGPGPSLFDHPGRVGEHDGNAARDTARAARVYVSFGTVLWRYYAQEALAALRAISTALAERPATRTVISLGRGEVSAADAAALERPNVTVLDYVDQWQVLAEADVFITHHGLNSTHEAIYSRVPMISYPFFWDQPAMARDCAALGFAVPLAPDPRSPIEPADVHRALDRCTSQRPEQLAALEEARLGELEVIAGREQVVDQILALR